MVQIKPRSPDRRVVIGVAFALTAGVCYGSTNVVGKTVVEDYPHPLAISAFALLFGMTIMLLLARKDVPNALRSSRSSLAIVAMAGLSSGGAVTAIYFALKNGEVVVVSPVVSVSPLVTLVLAHFFLRSLERITWRLVFGTILIVSGVILIVVGK